MKIAVIGATGTIGKAVVKELSARHEPIPIGKTHGQYHVDITSSESIRTLFAQLGKVDAIVSTTGNLHFGPLAEMTAEQFKIGLHDKLLGQIDIALIGQHYLNDGGSITFTSGIVSDEPILGGVNATTVNAAVNPALVADLLDAERQGGWGSVGHACEYETAMMLHLHADRVDMSKAERDIGQLKLKYFNWDYPEPSAYSWQDWWSRFSRVGVCGDAAVATSAFGQRLFDLTVERFVEMVREFRTIPIRPRVDHH